MLRRVISILVLATYFLSGLKSLYFVDKMEIYAIRKLDDHDSVYLHSFSLNEYLKSRDTKYFTSNAFIKRFLSFQSLTFVALLAWRSKYTKLAVLIASLLLYWGAYGETQMDRGDIHLCEFCGIWEGFHVALAFIIFIPFAISFMVRKERQLSRQESP